MQSIYDMEWVVTAHDHPWWRETVKLIGTSGKICPPSLLIERSTGEQEWVGSWVVDAKQDLDAEAHAEMLMEDAAVEESHGIK